MSPTVNLALAIVLMTVCTTAHRYTRDYQAIVPTVIMLVAFWFTWSFLDRAASPGGAPYALAFAIWGGGTGAATLAVSAILGDGLSGPQGALALGLAAIVSALWWVWSPTGPTG